jgi:hypothetical protein
MQPDYGGERAEIEVKPYFGSIVSLAIGVTANAAAIFCSAQMGTNP